MANGSTTFPQNIFLKKKTFKNVVFTSCQCGSQIATLDNLSVQSYPLRITVCSLFCGLPQGLSPDGCSLQTVACILERWHELKPIFF